MREGCRAYLIAECRTRFKLVDLRSVRSEFSASEKGKVKDGEGLLEALITGQIGSLHFVSIAKQWIAVERSWCSGIAHTAQDVAKAEPFGSRFQQDIVQALIEGVIGPMYDAVAPYDS